MAPSIIGCTLSADFMLRAKRSCRSKARTRIAAAEHTAYVEALYPAISTIST